METTIASYLTPDVLKVLLGFFAGWVPVGLQLLFTARKEWIANRRAKLAELLDISNQIKTVRYVSRSTDSDTISAHLEKAKHQITANIYVHNPAFKDLHQQIVALIIALQRDIEENHRGSSQSTLQSAVDRLMGPINKKTDELTMAIESKLRGLEYPCA